MRKVLIVDDDTVISESISEVLQKNSFSTEILDHTQGAVELILNIKPDLLLLDVMFPENPSAGFDLAREIRKEPGLKNLPVLFISSVNKEFSVNFSAGDMGDDWFPVQDFIEKPIDFNDLIKKINRII